VSPGSAILAAVAGDLKEQPGIRAALVKLTGGVQEARAEAHGASELRRVADGALHFLEAPPELRPPRRLELSSRNYPVASLRRSFRKCRAPSATATKARLHRGRSARSFLLHSTGQLHKGGPNTGFLQITSEAARSADPGDTLLVGTLFAAQARGDTRVLQAHGRAGLRVHVRGRRRWEGRRALRRR